MDATSFAPPKQYGCRVASPLKGERDKRVSRAENLLQRLEEEILLGKLPPGSRLDEKQLTLVELIEMF